MEMGEVFTYRCQKSQLFLSLPEPSHTIFAMIWFFKAKILQVWDQISQASWFGLNISILFPYVFYSSVSNAPVSLSVAVSMRWIFPLKVAH